MPFLPNNTSKNRRRHEPKGIRTKLIAKQIITLHACQNHIKVYARKQDRFPTSKEIDGAALAYDDDLTAMVSSMAFGLCVMDRSTR
jgi:hypothetical protein